MLWVAKYQESAKSMAYCYSKIQSTAFIPLGIVYGYPSISTAELSSCDRNWPYGLQNSKYLRLGHLQKKFTNTAVLLRVQGTW
jgi:hypothetical protein